MPPRKIFFPLSLLALATAILLTPPLRAQRPRGPALRTYQTPYYTLYTDISEADARETDLRLTRMFEEYQRRTAGFTGQVRAKFPFYLYTNAADYYAAGGPPKSAGVYIETSNGKFLAAVAGEHTDARTWHVIQHEGFHQFIAAALQRDLPAWTNEGLAEYFGEAIWTGDGFVTGLIPPDRLVEVKDAIRHGTFKSFAQILAMSDKDWGDKLEYSNYTEAWAMIHFLAHGDNGRYQGPFLQYMKQISNGVQPTFAFNNVFGSDTVAFEKRFANWWLNLPENPTRDLYLQAVVQTQTSFLARAYLQKQTFPDAATFFTTFKPTALAVNRDLWLPPSLFEETSTVAQRVGTWTLDAPPNQLPRLTCTEEEKIITGTFSLSNNRVAKVSIQLSTATPTPKDLPANTHAAPAR